MRRNRVAVLLSFTFLPLIAGCMWGSDTIRITTNPPDAEVIWSVTQYHLLDEPQRVQLRRYAGQSPTTFPAAWSYGPLVPYGAPRQEKFGVTIDVLRIRGSGVAQRIVDM